MNEALWRWLDRLYLGLSRPLGRAARTQALLREPFVQNPPLVAPPTQGRIVVLAPHPDDEAIGCGGTLRLAALGGAEVHCLLMTGGELGDAAGAPGETARVRRAEMQACAGLLGLTAVHELSGRDQRLAGRPELVDEMRNYLLELQPVALFLPFYMDAHIDHRLSVELLLAAAQATLPPELPLWGYEVWSPCPANVCVDISAVAEIKGRAIGLHASQDSLMHYAEAILGLNRYRAMQVNGRADPALTHAEAFVREPLGQYAERARRWLELNKDASGSISLDCSGLPPLQ